LLAIVAAIWGASYLFIKVAVDEVEPTAMMFFRLVLASAVLLPVLFWRVGTREAAAELRSTGWNAFGIGFLNAAFPFVLIAWGEKYVDSGVAAIANATVPIFVVLLAFKFNPSERVGGLKLGGILVGLVGVGVLAGLHPEGGWYAVAGTLAIVVASLSYAAANHFVQHNFSQTVPLVIATVSCCTGGLILLPFAVVQWPEKMPSWEAIASIATLGIVCTGIAFVFFHTLVASEGPATASLVGYVAPGFSVTYGVLLLDESFTVVTAIGLVLILGGSWLAAGGELPARRRDVSTTCEPHGGADAAFLEGGPEGGDRVAA
jgi:drug/metabolite transporter (DMT)-like permease